MDIILFLNPSSVGTNLGLDSNFNKPQFSQTVGLMFYKENDYQFDFLTEKKEKKEKKTVFQRFSAWLDKYI